MKLRSSPSWAACRVALVCGMLSASAAVRAADETPVRIGFAAPLTGVNAGYGKDLQNGVQLALDDARAQQIKIAGKPARFELVVEDDQADPRIGVQAAQSLVDKQVSAVVGHFNSGTTIPASVIYDKAGIPVIDPAATNPVIASRGLANVFMVIATDGQNAGNAGRYAVEVTKAKRIAIVDDRTAFGQGEADEFERAVKAAGGSIVAREYTNNQAVDFRAQITSLKSRNVDLLFFGGLDSLAANFIKQMRQLGLSAQFVGGGGVRDAEFIKIAGPAAEGAMAWEYGRPLDQLPQGKDFERRYKQRFGVDVLSYAQFGYDAAWAAIKAMQAASSTEPARWRPVLAKIDFDGITGRIAFSGDGSLKSGMSTLYRVKNGVWQTIVTKGG
ncbi:branched-chain amino acid ABC transporter substrate-binding protein [Burkholderia singularis]|nr:branched-chain amino acid ABC transporter substrate-binding protein [Burkholderia singularis]